MLYSKLFGKTKRQVAAKFESKNHELLVKAGFIDQVGSGIFNLLPLGKKVLTRIENIIRAGMNEINAQEVMMPLLQPKSFWTTSDRWDNVDVLFKTKSQYGHEYGMAPTHEEIVTPLAKKFINSYRDLPLYLYHITTKFRDEPRPKSGILRGREFSMKDLYSFHKNKEDLTEYYQKVTKAYLKIFSKCGLDNVKITEASGGSFTKKYSHEFNVITPAGEVNLVYCSKCTFAQNEEVSQLKQGDKCPKCSISEIKKAKAIEIGNIFDLGTRFSEAFDLQFVDELGKKNYVTMGCYGIGTSRLIGTITELHYDEKGILWPKNVAPYQIHIVGLDLRNTEVKNKSDKIYHDLIGQGIEVIFDDRDNVSAGEKFADADLIGIPVRLVVSKKTTNMIEFKKRDENDSRLIEIEKIVQCI